MLGTLTFRLADPLVVQSIVSYQYGRLFGDPREEPEHAGREPADAARRATAS